MRELTAPLTLPVRSRSAGTVMVTARVTPAEHAAWQDKAAAAGVSPSSLLWQAMARTRIAPAAAERERTRQVAGAGLGQVPERDIPLDAHVGERPL